MCEIISFKIIASGEAWSKLRMHVLPHNKTNKKQENKNILPLLTSSHHQNTPWCLNFWSGRLSEALLYVLFFKTKMKSCLSSWILFLWSFLILSYASIIKHNDFTNILLTLIIGIRISLPFSKVSFLECIWENVIVLCPYKSELAFSRYSMHMHWMKEYLTSFDK